MRSFYILDIPKTFMDLLICDGEPASAFTGFITQRAGTVGAFTATSAFVASSMIHCSLSYTSDYKRRFCFEKDCTLILDTIKGYRDVGTSDE
jgi:hypothetical protein